MAAWLSAYSEQFDCTTCKRTGFVCSKLGHERDAEVDKRIAESPLPKSAPLLFRAEAASVCPKVLLTGFASEVRKAHVWFERGSLGVTYLNAPFWLNSAFGILEHESSEAFKFKRRQEK